MSTTPATTTTPAITPELCKRTIVEDPNYAEIGHLLGAYESVMACPAHSPAGALETLVSVAYELLRDREKLPESMRATAGAIVWLAKHAALTAERAKPLTPDFISKP
jgi:hypothetical protein